MALNNITTVDSGEFDSAGIPWSSITANTGDYMFVTMRHGQSPNEGAIDALDIEGQVVTDAPPSVMRQSPERQTDYPSFATRYDVSNAFEFATIKPSLQPGDLVVINGDMGFGWQIDNLLGAANAPIRIMTNLSAPALYQMGGGQGSAAGTGGFKMFDCNYIELYDLSFNNTGTYGLELQSCDNVVVSGCKFYSNGTQGIRLTGSSTNIEIAFCEIKDTYRKLVDGHITSGEAGAAIMVGAASTGSGHDIHIHHNWMHDTVSGQAIKVFKEHYAVQIEDNFVERIRVPNGGALDIHRQNEPYTIQLSPQIEIRRNFVIDVYREETYGTTTSWTGGHGIVVGCRGVVTEYNIVYWTGGSSIYLWTTGWQNTTGNVEVAFNTLFKPSRDDTQTSNSEIRNYTSATTNTGNMVGQGQGNGNYVVQETDFVGGGTSPTSGTFNLIGGLLRPAVPGGGSIVDGWVLTEPLPTSVLTVGSGGTYSTISAAWAAATGNQTIRLVSNVTTASSGWNGPLNSLDNMVIDFAGYTYTINDTVGDGLGFREVGNLRILGDGGQSVTGGSTGKIVTTGTTENNTRNAISFGPNSKWCLVQGLTVERFAQGVASLPGYFYPSGPDDRSSCYIAVADCEFININPQDQRDDGPSAVSYYNVNIADASVSQPAWWPELCSQLVGGNQSTTLGIVCRTGVDGVQDTQADSDGNGVIFDDWEATQNRGSPWFSQLSTTWAASNGRHGIVENVAANNCRGACARVFNSQGPHRLNNNTANNCGQRAGTWEAAAFSTTTQGNTSETWGAILSNNYAEDCGTDFDENFTNWNLGNTWAGNVSRNCTNQSTGTGRSTITDDPQIGTDPLSMYPKLNWAAAGMASATYEAGHDLPGTVRDANQWPGAFDVVPGSSKWTKIDTATVLDAFGNTRTTTTDYGAIEAAIENLQGDAVPPSYPTIPGSPDATVSNMAQLIDAIIAAPGTSQYVIVLEDGEYMVPGSSDFLILDSAGYTGAGSAWTGGAVRCNGDIWILARNKWGPKFTCNSSPGTTTGYTDGIGITDVDSIRITGLHIRNPTDQCIHLGGAKRGYANGPSTNITIEHCWLEDAGQNAIKVDTGDGGAAAYAEHIKISANKIERTGRKLPQFGTCFYIGDGTNPDLNKVRDLLIEHNHFTNDGTNAGPVIMTKVHVQDTTIRYNHMKDQNVWKQGAISLSVENIAFNPTGAGTLTFVAERGFIIEGNTIHGIRHWSAFASDASGITIGAACKIRNNMIWDCGAHGIQIMRRNDLGFGTSGTVDIDHNTILNVNVYNAGYKSVAQSGTGNDTGTATVNVNSNAYGQGSDYGGTNLTNISVSDVEATVLTGDLIDTVNTGGPGPDVINPSLLDWPAWYLVTSSSFIDAAAVYSSGDWDLASELRPTAGSWDPGALDTSSTPVGSSTSGDFTELYNTYDAGTWKVYLKVWYRVIDGTETGNITFIGGQGTVMHGGYVVLSNVNSILAQSSIAHQQSLTWSTNQTPMAGTLCSAVIIGSKRGGSAITSTPADNDGATELVSWSDGFRYLWLGVEHDISTGVLESYDWTTSGAANWAVAVAIGVDPTDDAGGPGEPPVTGNTVADNQNIWLRVELIDDWQATGDSRVNVYMSTDDVPSDNLVVNWDHVATSRATGAITSEITVGDDLEFGYAIGEYLQVRRFTVRNDIGSVVSDVDFWADKATDYSKASKLGDDYNVSRGTYPDIAPHFVEPGAGALMVGTGNSGGDYGTSSDYAAAGWDTSTDLTMMVVYRSESDDNTAFKRMVYEQLSGGGQETVRIWAQDSRGQGYVANDAATVTGTDTQATKAAGQSTTEWTVCFVEFDQTNERMRIRVNDWVGTWQSLTGIGTNAIGQLVYGHPTGGTGWGGVIQQYALWTRLLSDEEISYLNGIIG